MPTSSDAVSFFDTPLDIKLAPFAEFDFGGVASWSEIELYAAVAGVDIDADFLNVLCTASYVFPNIYGILLTELTSENCHIDSLANSKRFVECVFKVWTNVIGGAAFSRPQRELARWLSANRKGVGLLYVSDDEAKRKKYFLLQALDNRFPYLLVKFYAEYGADLRADDEYFVVWLLERLEAKARSDPKLVPVYDALAKSNGENNRTAMYMR